MGTYSQYIMFKNIFASFAWSSSIFWGVCRSNLVQFDEILRSTKKLWILGIYGYFLSYSKEGCKGFDKFQSFCFSLYKIFEGLQLIQTPSQFYTYIHPLRLCFQNSWYNYNSFRRISYTSYFTLKISSFSKNLFFFVSKKSFLFKISSIKRLKRASLSCILKIKESLKFSIILNYTTQKIKKNKRATLKSFTQDCPCLKIHRNLHSIHLYKNSHYQKTSRMRLYSHF